MPRDHRRNQFYASTPSRQRRERVPTKLDMYSTSATMELQEILKTVLAEHEGPQDAGSTLKVVQAEVEETLRDGGSVRRSCGP